MKLIWRGNKHHMIYIHNIMSKRSYLKKSDILFTNEDIRLMGIIDVNRRQSILYIACRMYGFLSSGKL